MDGDEVRFTEHGAKNVSAERFNISCIEGNFYKRLKLQPSHDLAFPANPRRIFSEAAEATECTLICLEVPGTARSNDLPLRLKLKSFANVVAFVLT